VRAFATRTAYPDPPPPVVPHPGSLAAQNTQRPTPRLYCPDPRLGSELFPGIGVLPGPATGSHIVDRGTPVAPPRQPQLNFTARLKAPRLKRLLRYCCGEPLAKTFRCWQEDLGMPWFYAELIVPSSVFARRKSLSCTFSTAGALLMAGPSCVCVCVCVCEREREREREKKICNIQYTHSVPIHIHICARTCP
jgi:hypothetical protein